ncbi:hypothetical protein VMCG_02712 [Cytospora schulzeri]|uniref:Altered inheritance of mitochondria protein 6 n=1 Tax=Cytospora schulzeri TaxID=448051 RepID=A0A423WZK6_9PEZI|nr:hypothetical protein VMCG_02712 [Valsa malicola]
MNGGKVWSSVDRGVSADISGVDSRAAPPTQESNRNVITLFDFDEGDGSGSSRKRRNPWIICVVTFAFTFLTILFVMDIALRAGRRTWLKEENAAVDKVFSHLGEPGSIMNGNHTDFLKDVTPKPIHSHNDYWRKVPLFSALQQGCISVEADVWLFEQPERRDHLYVGHDEDSLKPDRTFQSLYIQPLVDILARQNPITDSYNFSSRGVFDVAPNQTLTLLVDVKTAGSETWTKVIEQLEPLRERGWLTHFANGTIHKRPITVVCTGNTPFDLLVQNTTYRDYFFDAPLAKLSDGPYDATNSYYASVSLGGAVGSTWFGSLRGDQVGKIRRQVGEAHAKGLKARYWDLPEWPVTTRNHIWDTLMEEGVDVLNADDIKAAAKREWK